MAYDPSPRSIRPSEKTVGRGAARRAGARLCRAIRDQPRQAGALSVQKDRRIRLDRRSGRQDVMRSGGRETRSEEHTSELQSLMSITYAVLCLKKKKPNYTRPEHNHK